MIRFDSDKDSSWWELAVAWKWPHQGFTIGYDLIIPSEQPDNGMFYHSVLLYLGPLSIIYNFGNHDYDN